VVGNGTRGNFQGFFGSIGNGENGIGKRDFLYIYSSAPNICYCILDVCDACVCMIFSYILVNVVAC
jgi:hypothetical protein